MKREEEIKATVELLQGFIGRTQDEIKKLESELRRIKEKERLGME